MVTIKISLVSFFIFLASTIFAQFINVQVNDVNYPSNYINQVNEVTIAVNPNNPNQLAAGSNLYFYYWSEDAGNTWQTKKMSSLYNVWGDPIVLFDNSNNLYYSHLSAPPSNLGYWIDRIVIQKSSDIGSTWDGGTGIGFREPKQQDKEGLAIDRTNSKYRNNIYIAWTEFDSYGSTNPNDKSRILFSYSNDDGKTWAEPQVISDTEGNCIDSDETTEGAVPAVGPNGEVYVAWAGPLGIMFDKSLDGGKTFGEDIFVGAQPGGWDYNVPGINRCNGLPVTLCDVSSSKYRGTIYVNWTDQRNGTDNTDVFIAKSTDGGNTWSDAIRVNNDDSKRHQFFTWMTIDQSTGYLYSVFYDRRNTSETYTDVYLARSTDGGETFSNYKISESSFKPNSSVFFGDYTSIDAVNGSIHPIWMEMNENIMSVLTTAIKDSQLVTNVISEDNLGIDDFKLYQNYPNPFNPNTKIEFDVPTDAFVTLSVYNNLGEKVVSLFEGDKHKGKYEIEFNAEKLASGTYYYKLTSGVNSISKKMVLIK